MTPHDTVGSGGGLRYRTEVPCTRMVRQERPDSCLVACVRQLLLDAGVDRSEAELRDRIGLIGGWGSSPSMAAPVLTQLHPTLDFQGGPVDEDAIAILLRRDPWIASVLTDYGRIHAIIVDGIADESLRVRDPWGVDGGSLDSGSEATISFEDFLYHWQGALHNVVFPVRRK